MKDIALLLQNLGNSAAIFRSLLEGIPPERRQERREDQNWTIQEWAAHLASTQEMLIARFQKIQKEEKAYISAHLPDFSQANPTLMAMDLENCLDTFAEKRKEMLANLETYSKSDWQKEAEHQEYKPFNAYILLRHVLLVDHVHFFNIERLWLSKEGYLKGK